MKRFLPLALLFALITTPAVAATLVDGSQINRTWTIQNGLGLKILGSGKITAIQSSGGILISSGSNLPTFFTDSYNRKVGIRTLTPDTPLEVIGTISGSVITGLTLNSSGSLVFEGAGSGSSLYLGRKLEGAGLSDCDASTQTLAWDVTTGRFSCGTDADTDTTYTAGRGLGLTSTAFSLNATITGTLVNFGTLSGQLLKAKDTLASSGSLVWEGTATGSILIVSGQFSGVGLTDCDLATQTLAWDSSTARFSCGTDSDTTYTAGQGLTLTSTSFTTNAVLTGTLVNFGTVSGSLLKAKTTLASSGTLVWETAASGSTLYVAQSVNGAGLSDCDNPTTSKLLWDATSGRFSCGSDQSGTSAFGSGNVLTLGDARYVRKAGSTMTGVLTIDILNGNRNTIGLKVINTASGAVIHAEKSLTTSGTLVFEGTATGSKLIATRLSGSLVTANVICPQTLQAAVFGTGTTVTTGSGKLRFTVPKTMSGFRLMDALISVDTAGTTSVTSVQVRNKQKGLRKLFSTVPSIDSAELDSGTAATPFVISSTNADVGGGDYLYVDIPGVNTTPPKGLNVLLYFGCSRT